MGKQWASLRPTCSCSITGSLPIWYSIPLIVRYSLARCPLQDWIDLDCVESPLVEVGILGPGDGRVFLECHFGALVVIAGDGVRHVNAFCPQKREDAD